MLAEGAHIACQGRAALPATACKVAAAAASCTHLPQPAPLTPLHPLQQFNPTALSKGKLQDNNEFMQWFYGYWESVVSGQEIEYDAVGRRQAAKSGDWKKVGAGGGCWWLRQWWTAGWQQHIEGWRGELLPQLAGSSLHSACLPSHLLCALQFSLGGAGARQASSTIPAVRRAGAAPVAPRAAAAAASKVPLQRVGAKAAPTSAPSRTSSASMEQLEQAQQDAEAMREQVRGAMRRAGEGAALQKTCGTGCCCWARRCREHAHDNSRLCLCKASASQLPNPNALPCAVPLRFR